MSQGRGSAKRMVEAAHARLDSRSADQRHRAPWDFPSDEERRRWFGHRLLVRC